MPKLTITSPARPRWGRARGSSPRRGRLGGGLKRRVRLFDRTYAVEGCREASPHAIPLFPPAAAWRPGATPTALSPRAGKDQFVTGRKPSPPASDRAHPVTEEYSMANFNPQELYGEFYYKTGCGVPYQRDEHWMAFFGNIAKEIVQRLSPRSVFDAGCALGLLIEQLRLLGVEAEGVDISEFAITNAPESVRPFVRVASVTEPLERRYDLIVCIEVLEHMPQREAETAIANLTAYTDDILFSSSPLDFKEATHVNVHPIEHWAELFAHHGFVRDVDFDASFITPWAMRLRRRAEPLPRIVRDYERRYWEVWKATTDLRELVLNQRTQIEHANQTIHSLRLELSAEHEKLLTYARSLEECSQALTSEHEKLLTYARSLEECSQALHEHQQALIATEHLLAAARQEYAHLKAYVQQLETDRDQKIAHINDLKSALARIESGRVMRILRALEDRRMAFFRPKEQQS